MIIEKSTGKCNWYYVLTTLIHNSGHVFSVSIPMYDDRTLSSDIFCPPKCKKIELDQRNTIFFLFYFLVQIENERILKVDLDFCLAVVQRCDQLNKSRFPRLSTTNIIHNLINSDEQRALCFNLTFYSDISCKI